MAMCFAASVCPQPNRHVILLNSGTGVKRGYYHKVRIIPCGRRFYGHYIRLSWHRRFFWVAIQDFDTSISEWGEKGLCRL